jgi:hypothetical protein
LSKSNEVAESVLLMFGSGGFYGGFGAGEEAIFIEGIFEEM